MSYVRDNGLARARKRRERRAMTILALCGLLVLGSIIFAATFISTPSNQSGPCPHGTVSVPPPESASFTVNVYNAGGPKGAAGNAADALKTHALRIGVVGNDPDKLTLADAGQVRYGPDGEALAKKYVSSLAPGTKLVDDGRDGTSVDVVLGSSFPTIAAGSQPSTTAPVCKK